MHYLDLTIPLNSHTPIYPGDPNVLISQKAFLHPDQFVMHTLSLGSHTGTHIDAPMHMLDQGKSLEEISLQTFFGEGLCVDVSKNYSLDTVKAEKILPDTVIFLYTGWDKKLGTPAYYEKFPPIPEDVCKYFVEQQVKMVGTDSPSADDIPFTSHKILLQNNIPIIESLIHLDKLLGKKFSVTALPLRVALDGSPVRVIATLL